MQLGLEVLMWFSLLSYLFSPYPAGLCESETHLSSLQQFCPAHHWHRYDSIIDYTGDQDSSDL